MNESGAGGAMSLERWDEALAWHSVLRDVREKDLTEAEIRGWETWCANPENRQVFDAVSHLLGVCLHREPQLPTKAELSQDRYDLSISIGEWLRFRAPRETRKRASSARRYWWISLGVAIVASLVLFALAPLQLWPGHAPSRAGVYRTDVGGLKVIHLGDGSTVILGGHTVAFVAFSAQRRSVSLVEGQAWFRVAHNPHWPFIVAAGDGTITAIGTAFVVTRDSNRIVVMVTEGTVEVSTRRPTPLSSSFTQGAVVGPVVEGIRVGHGEELEIGDNGAVSSIKPTDTRAATAWTLGRLTFDNQPLGYVIETVNRYSSRHIVVSAQAGALRFSGIVFSNEIADWIQSLEGIFPVTVHEETTDVRIHMRHPAPARRESLPKSHP